MRGAREQGFKSKECGIKENKREAETKWQRKHCASSATCTRSQPVAIRSSREIKIGDVRSTLERACAADGCDSNGGGGENIFRRMV